jgi:hypothetical protein
MKFFLFISLLGATVLGFTIQMGLHETRLPDLRVPDFLSKYQQEIKNSFKGPENANVLFSFITGYKNGISPYTRKAFKKTNLSFLLSPSGIHLSAVLLIVGFFLKKIKKKWIRHVSQSLFLVSFLFLPHFFSLKRLVILRLILKVNFFAKLKFPFEKVYLLTFAISFLIGHFHASPLSFIYSFMFLGTFFSLRDYPKMILILGLFSSQLIIALFMGEHVSLIAIAVGLIGSALFGLLFPFVLLFFVSFWIFKINWIEPLISLFLGFVKSSSVLLQGSFTSSSLFLILAVGILLHVSYSRKKMAAFGLLLILHTNTAMTPSIFTY